MASKGSFPLRACSLLAVNVSTSSTNTQTNVSSSSSSMASMLSNILLTSFPLSLKNLLPKECAFISTSLLCGNCFPRRIASFCASPRLFGRLAVVFLEYFCPLLPETCLSGSWRTPEKNDAIPIDDPCVELSRGKRHYSELSAAMKGYRREILTHSADSS